MKFYKASLSRRKILLKLKIEKIFQYIKMNFGELMSKIIPTWKARKLFLWWCHNVNGNAFRRINEINRELFEQDSITYNCNFCNNVVFKGSLKYGIILNCPSCGHQFCVFPGFPHGFKKMSLIQGASSEIEKISKDSKLLKF